MFTCWKNSFYYFYVMSNVQVIHINEQYKLWKWYWYIYVYVVAWEILLPCVKFLCSCPQFSSEKCAMCLLFHSISCITSMFVVKWMKACITAVLLGPSVPVRPVWAVKHRTTSATSHPTLSSTVTNLLLCFTQVSKWLNSTCVQIHLYVT